MIGIAAGFDLAGGVHATFVPVPEDKGVTKRKVGKATPMNHQRLRSIPAFVALLAVVTTGAVSASVKAGSQVFEGLTKHVSASQIDVFNPTTKKTQGFAIVPRFGNVFKSDGRTPAQVKDIRAGQYVKVYYDQKFLGAFHADRILIMSSMNQKLAVKHS
jgi:hypothetical protein